MSRAEEDAPAADEGIRKRISAMSEVSALPLSLQKIIAALSRDDLTISVLEGVIRHDQSLAAKIVSVADSAFYYVHRGVHVNSLDQAILVLGSSTIRNIAVGVSIFKIFPLPYRTLKQMWAHAYKIGLASAFLASRMEQSDKEIAFLAGLLHDIGRAALFSLATEEDISGFHHVSGPDIIRAEQDVFQCSHMQAGYWFLQGINLPDEIILPVLCHHDFSDQPEHPFIIAPVCIAEGIVSKLSADESIDAEWSEATETIATKFCINRPVLTECLELLVMEDQLIQSHFQE